MTLPSLVVFGQIAGLAAFVFGLFLLAGLSWALVTGGLVVTLWCAVAEAMLVDRRSGASARRSGTLGKGAA